MSTSSAGQRCSALIAAVLLSACGASEDGYRVVGELASDRIEISAEYDEPIIAIDVQEGQRVQAGQQLLRQDSRRAEARLLDAEARLAERRAFLDERLRGPRAELISAARAALEGASDDRDFRQAEMQRTLAVHERGLASPGDLDKARAALDAANALLKRRSAELEELLAGTTVEELEQAEQAVRQATAMRDLAAIDVRRHTLEAPVDATVDSRLFEVGERPVAGKTVLVLLGGDQPYARVYVPESLRVRVSAGNAARIFVDGLDTPLEGRVRWISSEASFTPYYALTQHDRGRLVYVAKIDIVDSRERLPDGVPVEVEFDSPSR